MKNNIQVQNMIDKLREFHTTDRLQFDGWCATYLSGDHNKELRQDICTTLTGTPQPKSKSGLFRTADLLKAHFEQFNLFSTPASLNDEYKNAIDGMYNSKREGDLFAAAQHEQTIHKIVTRP